MLVNERYLRFLENVIKSGGKLERSAIHGMDEVSSAMLTILMKYGLIRRESKGRYYVPEHVAELVRLAREFVDRAKPLAERVVGGRAEEVRRRIERLLELGFSPEEIEAALRELKR